jgi:hypothetical protein
MQVSQIAELDTHVVIGGGAQRAFGMSDSAEFFTVLSDTLYRDKKRAVVREVVCNADDAHKMVGKTDLPIDIKLTSDELIIRDFGPGIHDDRIVPIYCVYGASTKVNDDGQTGGFGLGSKAPFAYSDHFTVTSCHEGFKTVYSISRGGADTDGKPAIRTMVRVPTTDTGITVSIPLEKKEDEGDFERIIRMVVRQGGIKANLNGCELDTWDYGNAAKIGFAAIASHDLDESPVYVRYGAVLYPLSTEDPEIQKRVHSYRTDAALRLILMAPPGSIGVTPSREALSYSARTIETVTRLLDRAERRLLGARGQAQRAIADAYVQGLKTPANLRMSLHVNYGDQLWQLSDDPVRICRAYMAAANAHHGSLLHRFHFVKFYKTILKSAAARWPNLRRQLRRTQVSYGFSFEPDLTRLHRRLAIRFGLMGVLTRPAQVRGQARLIPFTKEAETPYSHNDVPALLLARTREQALQFMAKDYKYGNYVALIVPKSSASERGDIVWAAHAYGLNTEILDFTPVVRRPPQPKPPKQVVPIYDLSKVVSGYRGFRLPDENKITLATTPPVYVRSNGTPGEIRNSNRLGKILEYGANVFAIYPQIGLALTNKQEKALQEAGSKPLAEQFVADLLALPNTADVQFAELVRTGGLTESYGAYGSLHAFVDAFAKQDLRYAQALFADHVKITGEMRRALLLLRAYANAGAWCPGIEKVHGHLTKIRSAADKTWKPIIVSKALVEQQFAWLKPLKLLASDHLGGIPYSEELVDLIRHLKRRQKRQATVTPLNLNATLKEAA